MHTLGNQKQQTNSEYYSGEVAQLGDGTNSNSVTWPQTLPPLIFNDGATQTSVDNFDVFIDNVKQFGQAPYNFTTSLSTTITNGVAVQILTINTAVVVPGTSVIKVAFIDQSRWSNYGGYQYTPLSEVVNNFIINYVGTDKVIPRVRRTDLIYHAKRGIQEFSYDTLRSIKAQELTIPNNLSIVAPQDMVNYVQLSWVDQAGVKHIIYNTRLTSNPTAPVIQDDQGVPTQDQYGNNLESQQALINDRWRSSNQNNIAGSAGSENFTEADVYANAWYKNVYGQRYGAEPEVSQKNGWFTYDPRRNVFAFSSNLAQRLIILEYISDGLYNDENTKIPKLAEDALYAYMLYAVTSVKPRVPEYIVQRYKKEKVAKLRNAKIRLSNIKLEEFTQVMRGKSKWIKH